MSNLAADYLIAIAVAFLSPKASFAIDAIVAVYFAASRSRVPGLIVRSAQADDAREPALAVTVAVRTAPLESPMIIPRISRAVYAAASGSSSGQSWTLQRAASRITCPSMPIRVSPIPYTGHWQMNSSGPAGGSGHTHHRKS